VVDVAGSPPHTAGGNPLIAGEETEGNTRELPTFGRISTLFLGVRDQIPEGGQMGIIGWIILGLLAGVIAKAILPGDDPGGIIITTIIGVVGAFIGGLIAKALGFGDPIDEFFDLSTWLGAIIGSIVLLLIYRLLVGRGTRRSTAY
jgi:uncharacterized membrane protein YeaQ/YmgE (transglycosylase-associated protein family)